MNALPTGTSERVGTAGRVRWLFTDRRGGVSAPPFASFNLGSGVGDDPDSVRENRRRLAVLAGVDQVHWMRQVHSATVRIVGAGMTGNTDGEPSSDTDGGPSSDTDGGPSSDTDGGPSSDTDGGPSSDTDGMVTTSTGLALGVLAADCVPILAFDAGFGTTTGTGTRPDAAVVGVAHAGRIGAAAGIGPNLVAAMVRAGAHLDRIVVLLGPAVCGRCYEVPPQMQAEVEQCLPGSAVRSATGTAALDLRKGLARQFAELGVRRTVQSERCTMEDAQLFSHRRAAPTGRHAGLIWLVD